MLIIGNKCGIVSSQAPLSLCFHNARKYFSDSYIMLITRKSCVDVVLGRQRGKRKDISSHVKRFYSNIILVRFN